MSDTTTKKNNKVRNWVAICLGAIILIVGSIGVIKNESINQVFIETGAAQMASGIVTEQPKAGPVMLQVADVLDAAVQARTTSPKELAKLINNFIEAQGFKFDTSHLVNAVTNNINSAYAVSKTEEEYQARLLCLIRGIRSGVESVEVTETADVTTSCAE